MTVKILLITLLSIYFLAFLYLTKDVWLNPEAFLGKNRRRRAMFSAVWSIFPYNVVARFFDKRPRFELWTSRIAILFMYLVLLCGIVLIQTNSLR